jgi:hypothetical protein
MSTENAAPYAVATNPLQGREAIRIDAAARELAAFMSAVYLKFGGEASRRAATCWIEALEAADLPDEPRPGGMRSITIAAASRFATQELKSPCFSQ